MKIDKRSTTPLYVQLKDLILAKISTGEYGSGQRIPSEINLGEELELSRPTVRQAIAELVAEGILVIVKGKGTFVADEPERLDIRSFSPLTFSLLSAKSLADHDFQTIVKLPLSDDLESLFGHPAMLAQAGYWSLNWLLQSAGRTVGLCESLIPAGLFGEFGEQVRNGRPMLDILANKYAYLPVKGQTQLAVRSADNDEALALDVTRRSPVLTATSRLISRSEHVCEVNRIVWRPDRVSLTLDLGRT